jgi:hypothetical protein
MSELRIVYIAKLNPIISFFGCPLVVVLFSPCDLTPLKRFPGSNPGAPIPFRGTIKKIEVDQKMNEKTSKILKELEVAEKEYEINKAIRDRNRRKSS